MTHFPFTYLDGLTFLLSLAALLFALWSRSRKPEEWRRHPNYAPAMRLLWLGVVGWGANWLKDLTPHQTPLTLLLSLTATVCILFWGRSLWQISRRQTPPPAR